ncbi:hypothetical protein [Streptomyces sp. Ag109_O5-1]|uniref:hypothetical protein n=1 Tax=Streptomyces sp. Ag109_O5-1 TaxID=1938851 RepID=UPI000F4FDFFE|nr:hypothetical protein [Streptomyces sp. Ag109_O5-1]
MPFVRPYVRSDGTPVRGHTRWAPGARRELTIFAFVGLAVLGYGNSADAGDGSGTRPQPRVSYPNRYDRAGTGEQGRAVPSPTVSYPIRFDTPTTRPAVPTPTVSYPIDFSRLGSGR